MKNQGCIGAVQVHNRKGEHEASLSFSPSLPSSFGVLSGRLLHLRLRLTSELRRLVLDRLHALLQRTLGLGRILVQDTASLRQTVLRLLFKGPFPAAHVPVVEVPVALCHLCAEVDDVAAE